MIKKENKSRLKTKMSRSTVPKGTAYAAESYHKYEREKIQPKKYKELIRLNINGQQQLQSLNHKPCVSHVQSHEVGPTLHLQVQANKLKHNT